MAELLQTLSAEAALLLGDPHPLTRQLGRPSRAEALPSAGVDLHTCVTDADSLRRFLLAYRAEVLLPVELPSIVSAQHHGVRGASRELIALDRELSADGRLRRFAEASWAVGRGQLRRLLPMRDQTIVRRYWQAVEAGEARGWHVAVYGLVLAVYALPLRQGLASYAQQTLESFIASAAGRLRLNEGATGGLRREMTDHVPALVTAALGSAAGPRALSV